MNYHKYVAYNYILHYVINIIIVLLRCVWLGGGRIDVLSQCQFNILLCFRYGLCISISVFISSCHFTN